MKLLFTFLLLVTFVSQAAETSLTISESESGRKLIRKGNMELSGGFSASTTATGTTSINIYPALGYFVADNFVLGTSLTFETFKAKSSDSINTYGVGPYLGYYFYESGDWVGSFSQYLTVNSASGGTYIGSGATYLGAKYFISPRVAFAFEFGLNYPVGPLKTEDGATQILGRYHIYF